MDIQGNIVAEYKTVSCTVRISDAAYADRSEAELRRRRLLANRIAWEIAVKSAGREGDGHGARENSGEETVRGSL